MGFPWLIEGVAAKDDRPTLGLRLVGSVHLNGPCSSVQYGRLGITSFIKGSVSVEEQAWTNK